MNEKHRWHKAPISLPIALIIITAVSAFAAGGIYNTVSRLENDESYTLSFMKSKAVATCSMTASWNPSSVPKGSPSTLSWTSTGASSLRRECTNTCGAHVGKVSLGDPAVWLTPNVAGSAASPLGTTCVGTETCTFYCGDPAGGIAGLSKTLTVTPPACTISTSWSPSTITLPATTNWSYTSTNVVGALTTTCTSLDPAFNGTWGSQPNPSLGPVVKNPQKTATCTVTGKNSANVTCSSGPKTVIVNPPPACTITQTFNPSTVTPTQTTQYSWSSTGVADTSLNLTCVGGGPTGPWNIALQGAPQTKGPYPSTYTCTLTGKNSAGVTCSNVKTLTVSAATPPAGYKGCYTDTATRALPVQLGTTQETIESCRLRAKNAGYSYAGLQYYGTCFAGNALAYSQVADSQCNTPCTANPSEMCGGSWRNSIYSTAISSTASVTVTSPNTAVTWIASTTQAITWNSSGVPAGTLVYISLVNGTSTYFIAMGVPNTGNYSWKIPGNCYQYGPKSFCDANNKIQVSIFNPATGQFIATDSSNVNFKVYLRATFYKFAPGLSVYTNSTTSVRSAPGLSASIIATYSPGTYGFIAGEWAQYKDGIWWWRLEPSKWVPEGNLNLKWFERGQNVVATAPVPLYASPTSSVVVKTLSAGQSAVIGSDFVPKEVNMLCGGLSDGGDYFGCLVAAYGTIDDRDTWYCVRGDSGGCAWYRPDPWNPNILKPNGPGIIQIGNETPDGSVETVSTYSFFADPSNAQYNPELIYRPDGTFLKQTPPLPSVGFIQWGAKVVQAIQGAGFGARVTTIYVPHQSTPGPGCSQHSLTQDSCRGYMLTWSMDFPWSP